MWLWRSREVCLWRRSREVWLWRSRGVVVRKERLVHAQMLTFTHKYTENN